MGLLQDLFGRLVKQPAKNRPAAGYYRLLSGYTPTFSGWTGNIYESELVRAAINARATHASKLAVTVQGSAQPVLATAIKKAPSDLQTWSQFLYRLSTILDVRNTAFIAPILDEEDRTVGFYPLAPAQWDLLDVEGEPWLRFRFESADAMAIELSRVGIMTKFQYDHDLFGESNEALNPTLDLIQIQRKGISEAAKNSARFQFYGRINNFAKDADLEKERQRFDRETFQSEGGGMLLFPRSYEDIHQITQQTYSVDANLMAQIYKRIYEYFGVNEDILQNKAIGDAWSAFYEGAIEPFAIQLSEVLTRMVFTEREQGTGNQIFFTSNRLQYMSNADKLAVSSEMADRGLMTINEIREIWQLPPIEGGDTAIIRGEYYSTDDKLGGAQSDDAESAAQ